MQIPPAASASYPASAAQQRLWFFDSLTPGSAAYNLMVAHRLTGALDLAALERALTALHARHDALRTALAMRPAGLSQIVTGQIEPRLVVRDLSAAAPAQREQELAELLSNFNEEPFRLTEPPLLRCLLVSLGPLEWALALSAHHCIVDGWSFALLQRELSELYTAAVQRRPAALEPVVLQLGPYTVAERERLAARDASGESDADLAYWKAVLAGAPTRLELPADRPRPALHSGAGSSRWRMLSPALADAVRAGARALRATPFMIHAAAYATLLHRYGGGEEIVLGIPLANRTRRELQQLVGFVASTTVLRVALTDAPSFATVVARVRDQALGAYAHNELPFEQLGRELPVQRDLSVTPVFQTLFTLLAGGPPALALAGISVQRLFVRRRATPFDLSLVIEQGANRRRGVAEGDRASAPEGDRDRASAPEGDQLLVDYNSELYDADRIDRLLGHYVTLLEDALREPRRPIARLALMTAGERRTVLHDWNATARGWSVPAVHEQVIAAARTHPGRVAVRAVDGTVSYAELVECVRRRAAELSELARPGERIAVLLEPSVELVVTLLAVMTIGASYVPLDPAYPVGRLELMIDDCDAAALLTTRALQERLRLAPRAVLLIDEARTGRGAEPAVEVHCTSDDVVYTIYTSGSTGRPKGVEITHGALINLLASVRELVGFDHEDTLVSVTSASFDIAALELFLPLIAGGTLVIADADTRRHPQALAALLSASRATVMQATPSFWQMLLDGAGEESLPRLRVLCGGEPLPPRLAARLERAASAAWNVYGPTETTIWSTAARLDGGPVTVGRPLANTRAYVLDPNGEPLPIGIWGELVLAGAGVGRGYLGRPELTAERFVRLPSSLGGGRAYRSGDIARRLPNGSLELRGRSDNQVKLRGHRIELEEIEAALCAHPQVRECAAAIHEHGLDDRRLVAFVVTNGHQVTSEELRDHAQSVLPPYALPSSFMALAALPRMPNGKLDRAALPSAVEQVANGRPLGTMTAASMLADDGLPSAAPAAGARDALELKLLEIWRATLGREDVGVGDSFFDLGGHSLLALALIEVVREQTGHALPLDAVLRSGTVEAAARVLRDVQPAGGVRSHVRLNRTGNARLHCVHSLVGTALRYRSLAVLLDGTVELHAFQAPGVIAGERPLDSIGALAERYLDELRELDPRGPYALAGYSLGGLVAYEMATRLLAEQGEPPLLLLLEAFAPDASHAAEQRTAPELSLAGSFGGDWDAAAIMALTPEQRLQHIWQRARERGLLPPGVGVERLRRYLDVVEAHLAAIDAYSPAPYPSDVVLFRTAERYVDDETLGWGALVGDGLEIVDLPGNHGTLLESPTLEVLARELKARLAVALRFAA